MQIKVSKTTEKQIEKFNKKAWRKPDIEHYGRPVNWKKKGLFFKATERGATVGIIKARHNGGVIYIRNIIIDERRRGRGIGEKLMNKIEEAGKRLGAHKLYLFTGEKWSSIKFYRKLGFKKIANLPKFYFKKDFVIYSKSI